MKFPCIAVLLPCLCLPALGQAALAPPPPQDDTEAAASGSGGSAWTSADQAALTFDPSHEPLAEAARPGQDPAEVLRQLGFDPRSDPADLLRRIQAALEDASRLEVEARILEQKADQAREAVVLKPWADTAALRKEAGQAAEQAQAARFKADQAADRAVLLREACGKLADLAEAIRAEDADKAEAPKP